MVQIRKISLHDTQLKSLCKKNRMQTVRTPCTTKTNNTTDYNTTSKITTTGRRIVRKYHLMDKANIRHQCVPPCWAVRWSAGTWTGTASLPARPRPSPAIGEKARKRRGQSMSQARNRNTTICSREGSPSTKPDIISHPIIQSIHLKPIIPNRSIQTFSSILILACTTCSIPGLLRNRSINSFHWA